VVDEAGIVVSELLGNAMKHAVALPDGRVRVHWQVKSGVVELDVTDGGGGAAPRPQQPADYATAGRGLRVVRSLGHDGVWWTTSAAAPCGPPSVDPRGDGASEGSALWAGCGTAP
jgi:hypothetical protein